MVSLVVGVNDFRAALKNAPAHLRKETFEAIKITVEGVYKRGRANIVSMVKQGEPNTGALLKNYRRRTSKKTLKGRVGYLSPAARKKVKYARFVHDGTAKMTERRFHANAVDAVRDEDTRRMVNARNNVLKEIGRQGRASITFTHARSSTRRVPTSARALSRLLRPGRF